MKCYLTRLAGITPRYMLTRFKPTIKTIKGTKRKDAYIIPGDPLGIPGNPSLCDFVRQVCKVRELKELETTQINLYGEEII